MSGLNELVQQSAQIKNMLNGLQACRIDFSVIFSDQNVRMSSKGIKLGDYTDSTRQIRIFVSRVHSLAQILEVAIHEYSHHLMNEACIFHESGRVIHGKKFWQCYNHLMEMARKQGVFNRNNSFCPDERIQQITDKWFIKEPLLMMTMLTHEIKPTQHTDSIRCGKGMIEYNPQYVSFLSSEQFEERLKAEVIRILLCHPYRLPAGSNKAKAYMASNITVNEYYPFKYLLYKASDYWHDATYQNKNFEFYYREVMKLIIPSGENGLKSESTETNQDNNDNRKIDKPAANSQQEQDDSEQNDKEQDGDGQNDGEPTIDYAETAPNAALWEEDDYMEQQIKEVIEWAHSNMTWGSLPANLVQTLIASLKPVIDYRKVLNGFRATVLSSDKMLTRFKPSRRYGFEYMGKKSQFTTKLLIGVDVSGSISDQEINLFYSTVNRFFKYGIQSLEVQQFDCELKGKPIEMKKAQKNIHVMGRGGTNFQPIIDFFVKNKKKYDGLIIFTDGYAKIPDTKPFIARKMLWICNNKHNYEKHHDWMSKMGRCCWVGEK
ncbi:hypothetical protein AGMMS49982_18690 [Bacteroidia bacterium]|nr:hypothetical protein AGMMS49982_18690 [Bacteroidia bacterium]